MTTADVLERRADADSGEVADRLAREMEAILEEAQRPHEAEQPVAGQWSYRVPFAGVRYYSF